MALRTSCEGFLTIPTKPIFFHLQTGPFGGRNVQNWSNCHIL